VDIQKSEGESVYVVGFDFEGKRSMGDEKMLACVL